MLTVEDAKATSMLFHSRFKSSFVDFYCAVVAQNACYDDVLSLTLGQSKGTVSLKAKKVDIKHIRPQLATTNAPGR